MVRFNSRTPCGVRLRMRHRHADQPSFNSRTPCGVRPRRGAQAVRSRVFQFTHPVRGATILLRLILRECYVSIHAPRAGCDKVEQGWVPSLWVSIHAPRAGCDTSFEVGAMAIAVSIHAPRAGCDLVCKKVPCNVGRFNSRTPCGVRQIEARELDVARSFQFTHPVRGATATQYHCT